MKPSFYVEASWDAEAGVWISDSDIPGLVIEAATLQEFEHLMMELAPEMLALNSGIHNQSVPLEFRVNDRRELAVA